MTALKRFIESVLTMQITSTMKRLKQCYSFRSCFAFIWRENYAAISPPGTVRR